MENHILIIFLLSLLNNNLSPSDVLINKVVVVLDIFQEPDYENSSPRNALDLTIESSRFEDENGFLYEI